MELTRPFFQFKNIFIFMNDIFSQQHNKGFPNSLFLLINIFSLLSFLFI